MTVADWNFWMGEIDKESKAAHSWLKKRHPSEWSKAYFMTYVKSGILLNNLCEVFNNVVSEEREKSILTMLIDLHISFMKRIQAMRDKMRKVTGPLCPKVQLKLLKSCELADGYEVDWSSGAQSYVKCPSGEFVVDLHNKMCACRRWDLSGIPCGQAVATILDRRGSLGVDALPVKPPNWVMSKWGRKQKKKRRQAEEDVITYVGSKNKLKKRGITVMTCSVCGGTGHNIRYHQKPDSTHEAWFESAINPVNEDRSNYIVSDNSRVKLVARRPPSNTANEVQPSTPKSNFQFIPTPDIGITSASQFTNYDPALNKLGSSTMEKAHPQMQTASIPLESLVEDLHDIENQEKSRKRTTMVKNKKVVQGSVTFKPPRTKKYSATQ